MTDTVPEDVSHPLMELVAEELKLQLFAMKRSVATPEEAEKVAYLIADQVLDHYDVSLRKMPRYHASNTPIR